MLLNPAQASLVPLFTVVVVGAIAFIGVVLMLANLFRQLINHTAPSTSLREQEIVDREKACPERSRRGSL